MDARLLQRGSESTQVSSSTFIDTSVAEDTAYTYTIVTGNSNGPGATSAPATATTPVAPPLNLTLNAVSTSEIDLSWDNESSASRKSSGPPMG